MFFSKNKEFISDLITHRDILIIGDFNIHFNKGADPLSKSYSVLIDTYGFIQFVHEPCYCSGNKLNLHP